MELGDRAVMRGVDKVVSMERVESSSEYVRDGNLEATSHFRVSNTVSSPEKGLSSRLSPPLDARNRKVVPVSDSKDRSASGYSQLSNSEDECSDLEVAVEGSGHSLSWHKQRLQSINRRSLRAVCTRICCGRRPNYKARVMDLKGNTDPSEFVDNGVSNTKYNILTFLPAVLYEQFKFFFNLFYLGVALAQFVPVLKVGPLFTYLAPLGFVMTVTILKEASDDYTRRMRDREANRQIFFRVTAKGLVETAASDIKVGHIIEMHANQRVPADMIFLRTSNEHGSTFVRTDQLDGETDWKLRRAVQNTQFLSCNEDLFSLDALFQVEAPRRDIYEFVGKFTSFRGGEQSSCGSSSSGSVDEALGLENTLWANTVVTSGTVVGLAVYTGRETRSTMNTSGAKTKTGLFDEEVNFLSKVLFVLLTILAFILSFFKGLEGIWWVYSLRFMLLLSSIIPISLRVNLDMAKTLCSVRIARDKRIPDTLVRTSTIPEELGRVDYLLTDKTGTLTQNDMVFKKLHLGRALFEREELQQMRTILVGVTSGRPVAGDVSSPSRAGVSGGQSKGGLPVQQVSSRPLEHSKKCLRNDSVLSLEVGEKLREALLALSVCHNVTPVEEGDGSCTLQAASPDEVALVKFASEVGISLLERTDSEIRLRCVDRVLVYRIRHCFPFSSESKRMGIIVEEVTSGALHFYLKGAENVILPLLQPKGSGWLAEETDNFARQGLRTLVVCHKPLTSSQMHTFEVRYANAAKAMHDRSKKIRKELNTLEQDMNILCLTGVEDTLQPHVPATLEALRHAGIKIWMLTGDKIQTATCIAISAGLKPRSHTLCVITWEKDEEDVKKALQKFAMGPRDSVLVLDGAAISVCLKNFESYFVQVAASAPAVICCRCSPTQKAEIVEAIKIHTGRRTCAIGDGGNDVSMIQSADLGVGIVGKEGKQASLAADFSLTQFSYLRRLLLWHGRNSYQRSAKLAQFVIHRGLIIAVIQILFSATFFFVPIAIFQGWLQVGYATYYTTAPVFSLVLDVELPEKIVFLFPELYRSLRTGRVMSIKTFFAWVWMSIYQGAVIMMGAILLFENTFTNIISITFTALILSELLNVASEIQTWHSLMVASQICTIVIYVFSMFILRSCFDISFIMTATFWWKVLAITIVSWLPVHVFKVIDKIVRPPQYAKLIAV